MSSEERGRAPAGRYRGRAGYGDPRTERRGRILRWAGAVLFGLALAAVVYTAVGSSQSDIQGDVTGFENVGKRAVQIRFEVTKPAGADVLCVLRARDRSGAEIGRAEVPIPASAGTHSTQSYTLATTGLPVSGEIVGCGLAPDSGSSPAG